jgi:hypothetical protein
MLMPEWYFLLILLGFLTALGASWTPLLWLAPMLGAGLSLTLMQAARAGHRASFDPQERSKFCRGAMRLLVTWLHVAQPAARLLGRIQHGMGPWSWKGFTPIIPRTTITSLWTVRWEPIHSRLSEVESILKKSGATVVAGGDFDSWDLSIRGGLFGAIRVVAMIEEHERGQQLCRFRAWPKVPAGIVTMLPAFVMVTLLAVLDGAVVAGSMISLTAGILGLLICADCAFAMSHWRDAIDSYLRLKDDLWVVSPVASTAEINPAPSID